MDSESKRKETSSHTLATQQTHALYRHIAYMHTTLTMLFCGSKTHWFDLPRPNLLKQFPLRVLVFASFLMPHAVLSLAQEQNFPFPSTAGTVGSKDAGAEAEIRQHLQAVSGAGWQDLQGTGTLTYPSGDTHKASLYLMGSDNSRLDVTMDSGTRSLRISGAVGRFHDDRDDQGYLPPGTASTGIVAFPRIWTAFTSSPLLSLYDRDLYGGSGENLHRITIEHSVDNDSSSRAGKKTAATDLYFDPTTHLLLFSVDSIVFNRVRHPLMRVTSYSAYQSFNGVLVPTVIRQALNGQEQWTLHLTQVEINTHLSADTFLF